MENTMNTNYAELSGKVVDSPILSHENRGERFYMFPLAVERLSGAQDTLKIIMREKLLTSAAPQTHKRLHVFGQLRSFNNKNPNGPKLIISLFARDFNTDCAEDQNDVLLRGTICKTPTLRKTPLGREISDFMLAVNRKYNQSDYIPCIAWGQKAHEISKKTVGTSITVNGRFQSRQYLKIIENMPVHKTAYEISMLDYE